MNLKTRVLSDEDILKIHATSLEVMEKLGIERSALVDRSYIDLLTENGDAGP